VIGQAQKMHVGLAPKPDQKLQTLETDHEGYRKTGFDIEAKVPIRNQKYASF